MTDLGLTEVTGRNHAIADLLPSPYQRLLRLCEGRLRYQLGSIQPFLQQLLGLFLRQHLRIEPKIGVVGHKAYSANALE